MVPTNASRAAAIRARHSAARIECLDLVEELLLRVVSKSEHGRLTVKREMVAAFFVAMAVHNDHCAKPLDWGLRDSVFLCDEVYAVVRASNLHDVARDVRRCFPELVDR